jgi:hypothetical protein
MPAQKILVDWDDEGPHVVSECSPFFRDPITD